MRARRSGLLLVSPACAAGLSTEGARRLRLRPLSSPAIDAASTPLAASAVGCMLGSASVSPPCGEVSPHREACTSITSSSLDESSLASSSSEPPSPPRPRAGWAWRAAEEGPLPAHGRAPCSAPPANAAMTGAGARDGRLAATVQARERLVSWRSSEVCRLERSRVTCRSQWYMST